MSTQPNTAPFREPYGPRDGAPRAPTFAQLAAASATTALHNQMPGHAQLCRHCREVLPVAAFGGLRTTSDGLRRSQPWCIACRFKYRSVDHHKAHPDQLALPLSEQLRLKFPRRGAVHSRQPQRKATTMGTLHQLPLPIIRTVRERVQDNRDDRRDKACESFRRGVSAWLDLAGMQSADPDRLRVCNLRSIYSDAFDAMDRRYLRLYDLRRIVADLTRHAPGPVKFLPGVDAERWRWLAAAGTEEQGMTELGAQRRAYVDRPQYAGQCGGV